MMRRICEFLFPFLFERNWHSGEREWNHRRVALFLGAVGFILIGILIVAFLQAPINYTAST